MPSALLLSFTVGLLAVSPMPSDTIPEPATVSVSEVPVPAVRPPDTPDTTAALYYLIFDGRNEQFDENDAPETILQALHEAGLALDDAWAPLTTSIRVPCMAPNVYPALVVKLKAADEAITAFGFTADPERIFPNCGVEQFDHYAFDE